jgi:hypothetical protein
MARRHIGGEFMGRILSGTDMPTIGPDREELGELHRPYALAGGSVKD